MIYPFLIIHRIIHRLNKKYLYYILIILIMYALVRYIDDGVYYVCDIKRITTPKSRGRNPIVKYEDGWSYAAEILCTNKNKNTLNIVKRNLMLNVPRIECVRFIGSNKVKNPANEINDSQDSITSPDYLLEEFLHDAENDFNDYDDDSIVDPDYVPEELVDNADTVVVDTVDEAAVRIDTIADNVDDLVPIANNNEYMSHLKSYNSVNSMAPKFQSSNEMITLCDFANSKKKKYFCIYCKTKVTHFPRHLENIHKNENDVKLFSSLPKGDEERKKIIELIRKRGNFLYNCDNNYNEGDLLVTRRPTAGKSKTSENFLPCSNCFGFYGKSSLRKHVKNCMPKSNNHQRSVLVMGRRVRLDISDKANDIVKRYIFPVLREDAITKPLKYDELTIVYANKMTTKYRMQHHYPMIRTRIRLIGRILHELKKLDSSITDFASVFTPKQYDNVIAAINSVADLDVHKRKYKAPSTASSCGTLLKKCGNIYIAELIKTQNKLRKKEVEDFLKLMEVDFCTAVNKTVSENQLQHKRNKKVLLPNISDIQALNQYLKENRQKYYKLVLSDFSVYNYKKLAAFTLTSVQVFNRRRAGEIERIEINDFKNYQSIDKNSDDIVQSLSSEELQAAKNYVRFVIRGKLGREVPVLLYKELILCIDLLIKNRHHAGVMETNPYVFGIPSSNNEPKYLKACNLLKQFSELCGAKEPSSLRGTNLRKQIATHSVIYNLTDTEVTDLANFMGHHERIHKNHYRMPIVARDITRMSRLLRMAQGDKDYDGNNEASESGEESDLENENDDGDQFENAQRELSECDMNISVSPTTTVKATMKRSTSPIGSVVRRTWTEEELHVAKTVFNDYIINGNLPSLNDCQNVIADNGELHSRSPMQLKLWISNQITKRKKKSASPPNKMKITRTHWTSPEKTLAYKLFKTNIDKQELPSIGVCRKIINSNTEFKKRTPIQLKLWVHNQLKKKSQKH